MSGSRIFARHSRELSGTRPVSVAHPSRLWVTFAEFRAPVCGRNFQYPCRGARAQQCPTAHQPANPFRRLRPDLIKQTPAVGIQFAEPIGLQPLKRRSRLSNPPPPGSTGGGPGLEGGRQGAGAPSWMDSLTSRLHTFRPKNDRCLTRSSAQEQRWVEL
jgi:hypothetical protein